MKKSYKKATKVFDLWVQAYIFFKFIACFTNLACGLLIIQIHGDKIEFVMKKKCKL